MKLRQYIKEQKGITVEEYKALDSIDRAIIFGDFNRFNAREQQFLHRQGWRPMTPEEKAETEKQVQKEQERYRINKMIGGIDSRGNYTALHHRWEEKQ